MEVHVYCTDPAHPIIPVLERWRAERAPSRTILLVKDESKLVGGDILFLVSVGKLVKREVLSRYRAAIVLHASDLPRGRGWSPVVWQILEGKKTITVTALSAEDKVDSGDIWAQQTIAIEDHEVFKEINRKLFSVELSLMDYVMDNLESVSPTAQAKEGDTYYRKRTPEDSRIDPHSTIAEQFDLLRVCDPDRYPAFFELRGHRYRLLIEKLEEPSIQV